MGEGGIERGIGWESEQAHEGNSKRTDHRKTHGSRQKSHSGFVAQHHDISRLNIIGQQHQASASSETGSPQPDRQIPRFRAISIYRTMNQKVTWRRRLEAHRIGLKQRRV